MDDERCCGTGTCIINADGLCWCGQQWNGSTMCFPQSEPPDVPVKTRSAVPSGTASTLAPTAPTSGPSGFHAGEHPVSR